MANVIYRGDMRLPPHTKCAPVATALKPGSAVKLTGGQLTASDAGDKEFLVLTNLDFTGQSVETAYEALDEGAAYEISQAHQYFQFIAGEAVTVGAEIAVGAGGAFAVATAGDTVVAIAESAADTGELFDVRTVFPYVKA